MLNYVLNTFVKRIHGHVLSRIFNCFDHDYVFRHNNEISGGKDAHVSNLFMCERSNLYGTKKHSYILHKYVSEKLIH